MEYSPVNRFRTKRGRKLRKQIEALAEHLGRDVRILDVGGRADYWANVGMDRIAHIEILNYSIDELNREVAQDTSLPIESEKLSRRVGDARNLADYPDASVDLVHSNSVIEHVGGWRDMTAMANEVMRVGRAGWVQTPAWEFPIEPHFRAPFLHWFGEPLRARMLSLSAQSRHRRMDVHKRRLRVESINLLSERELKALFPDRALRRERVVLVKSYIVAWMPEGAALPF